MATPLLSHAPIEVGTTLEATTPIPLQPADGGGFFVPADSDITEITWGAGGPTADRAGEIDDNGGAVTTAVTAGKYYFIPATINAAHYLYPIGDAAGTIFVDTKKAGEGSP